MQARLGARGPDVKEASRLDVFRFAFEVTHVFVSGIFGGARLAYGCQQQPFFRERLPDDERRLIVALRAIEPGHDYGVELEPFRLVHRHDFHCVGAGVHVGQREEFGETVRQRIVIGEVTRLVLVGELVEKNLGVLELGRIGAARRAAEREPYAFDAIAQVAAQALRQRGIEHDADAFQPAARIIVEQLDARVVAHRFPYRIPPAFHQRGELDGGEPAPRCPQHGKPCGAIRQVRKRTCQRIEILHHLFFSQPLDLNRAIAKCGLFQRWHDVIEMAAITHQDGDRALRMLCARGLRDLDHAPRFVFALIEQMPTHRVSFERRMVCDRGRIRYCP